MDKSQNSLIIKGLGDLSYPLTSTAMVMILLQVGLDHVSYDNSVESIMSLFLPIIVLLTGIWVPTLKARRLVKQHNDSSVGDF